MLRLPFAATGVPPEGFATAVTLPLRDEAAILLAERLLAETGPAIMLALPALAGIEIEIDGTTRLLTATHDGETSLTVDGASADGVPRVLKAEPIRGCWPTVLPRRGRVRPGRCVGPCLL